MSTATHPGKHGAHAAQVPPEPDQDFDEDDRAMQVAAAQ